MIYIWYYFTVQFEQIFWYWVIGMAIGSLVSVFAKEKINQTFVKINDTKLGVLGIIPACLLGIASPLCMYGTIPIAASFSKQGMRDDWLASFMMASVLLMNSAMLTDIGNTAVQQVPTLYLTKKISYALGAVFSIILIMGIFSSCSAMLWTISERFVVQGTRKSYIFAVCTCIAAFLLGLLPFAHLVGRVYTLLGYVGLIFSACVIYKRFISWYNGY